MRSQETEEQPLLSIIIPTLNEGRSIGATLEAVARVRGRFEVIVVDGGSDDETVEVAESFGAQVVKSGSGRGLQMHAGACAARGEALWFLHADTLAPSDGAERIAEALRNDAGTVGGNFTISFDGDRRAARFLTWLYPQLRKIGLCYGDSAIFVRASYYSEVGGFKPFPLFEDLDLVRRLRARGRLIHLPVPVVTSSRRFEGRSFTLTFMRWAFLQALYWAGVNPHTLNRLYAPIRRADD
jgi:rSAM/selenodomain-associated transferase 2